MKARIDKMQQNSKCRLCGDRDENNNHIIEKLWNMKVTIIPIVIDAFGTVTRGLLKGLGRCPWCNCYRRRKWTRRLEFKSWTRLIAFHIALIPLGKV